MCVQVVVIGGPLITKGNYQCPVSPSVVGCDFTVTLVKSINQISMLMHRNLRSWASWHLRKDTTE